MPVTVGRFDQSDASNITHGLHIGTVENDASADINTVTYYLDDVLVTKDAYMSALDTGAGYTKAQVYVELDSGDMNSDLYFWCHNHANMGANIITEQWESIGNEGFIASTGYMSIRDFSVDSEGNSQSQQYSTSLLGTSAVNPVTENQDIAFSYFFCDIHSYWQIAIIKYESKGKI